MRAVFHKGMVLMRATHAYVSMLVLVAMSFFAVTGLMLNHKALFGLEGQAGSVRTAQRSGSAPADLLAKPKKRPVATWLEGEFGLHGKVTNFEADGTQVCATIERPGYQASAVVDRKTGKTDVTEQEGGAAALLTDLHRGERAGNRWRLVIDATAAAVLIATLSGLAVWLATPKRRVWGAAFLVAGVAGSVAMYLAVTPR